MDTIWSLLETQTLRPHPDLPNQDQRFNKTSQVTLLWSIYNKVYPDTVVMVYLGFCLIFSFLHGSSMIAPSAYLSHWRVVRKYSLNERMNE